MFEKYLTHEVAGVGDRILAGTATIAEWKV
jgi:hypothetical protein